MRKKYSDPLMFPSILLNGTMPVGISGEITPTPDEEITESSKVLMNAAPATRTVEDPVTIVNPVEEAVTNASTSVTTGITTESPVEAVSTSPLEVESVIDEIVPEVTEEASSTATTN